VKLIPTPKVQALADALKELDRWDPGQKEVWSKTHSFGEVMSKRGEAMSAIIKSARAVVEELNG
jgi:hypothetical protein